MDERLPTAPAGAVVALDGALFNRVMRLLESLSHVAVTPPLTLSQGPNGLLFGIAASAPRVLLVGTGNAALAGTYTAQVVQFATPLIDPTSSGQFTADQIGVGAGDTVYMINIREQDKSAGDASQWDLIFDGSRNPTGFWGSYYGQAPDGKTMFLIDGVQSKNCSGGG